MPRRYASYSVESLRAYAETNLPTHIDTIESDESVTLTDPVSYLIGVDPGSEVYPRCEFEFDEGGWYQNDMRNRSVADSIFFHLISACPDADILTWQEDLRRYQAAMVLMLRENPTLGGVSWRCTPESWSIGGAGDVSEGLLRGVVTVQVLLVYTETA